MTARAIVPALLAIALGGGCAEDLSDATAVDLEIRYRAEDELDRIALSATAGTSDIMERTLLPSPARRLDPSGREGLIILVSDALDGEKITIQADGMRDEVAVVRGTVEVTAHEAELTPARINVDKPIPCAVPDEGGCGARSPLE